MTDINFEEFPKIARLSREMVITEKLDGTNAQVQILEDGTVLAGSRNQYITPKNDNYGFARWVEAHEEELRILGPGRHYGEWWGSGIQRGYGLKGGDKRFSLFNIKRWSDPAVRPACCDVVPVLYRGLFDTNVIHEIMDSLRIGGSFAMRGFMNPEGIIIYHVASGQLFKKTLDKDDEWKGKSA